MPTPQRIYKQRMIEISFKFHTVSVFQLANGTNGKIVCLNYSSIEAVIQFFFYCFRAQLICAICAICVRYYTESGT